MCGIVGLYLKKPELEDQLGQLFSPMLIGMSERGPDSAGIALYGDPVADGRLKLTLQHPDMDYDWDGVKKALETQSGAAVSVDACDNHRTFDVQGDEETLSQWAEANLPGVTIMSLGQRIVILKEMGTPQEIVDRFDLTNVKGGHAVGHTRMATESAVTTAGSHPFSTGQDLCLVHNGSLSNHNRLREVIERRSSIRFQTENDTEVAAGYLTWKLREGMDLDSALEAALEDLDGFYTFAIGTADGFAALRDPIACKPAVLAETDDWVAMASEFRSLAHLPGVENAKVWEPEPAKIYTWGRAA
jgi:methylamine---glutamate N-methyltransferase subunit A